jgi:hypothetical protein
MMFDFITLAAFGSMAISAIAIIGFWMNFSDRISDARNEARIAREVAKENSERISSMNASFALYREQVARDYISREMMQEFERRLTSAIDKLGERFDRYVESILHKND